MERTAQNHFYPHDSSAKANTPPDCPSQVKSASHHRKKTSACTTIPREYSRNAHLLRLLSSVGSHIRYGNSVSHKIQPQTATSRWRLCASTRQVTNSTIHLLIRVVVEARAGFATMCELNTEERWPRTVYILLPHRCQQRNSLGGAGTNSPQTGLRPK